MKIAIIGGGAAGMTTAHLLDGIHHVTVFEKQPILGGNVRTLNKNVQGVDLDPALKIDNGVIEFQRDHFVNFHKLMDRLGVATEPIVGGGSSSLFLANGRYILGPGMLKKSATGIGRWPGVAKLLSVGWDYRRFMQMTAAEGVGRQKPIGHFLKQKSWHKWQKMLLMYGYSIPYRQIDDFPADIAIDILRNSGMGTRWTRVVDGVYTYFERILASFEGNVHCNAQLQAIRRTANGVEIDSAESVSRLFDAVVFACPPDQVLKLLADPTDDERRRFGAWRQNVAETIIHTDTSMYEPYGVKHFSEFDVFEKGDGDAGYNAFLNRLIGVPESAPHYNLSFNLDEWVDPKQIIQRQQHFTPLYTTEAAQFRDEVRATNGENHTFHAGAYLGNGLHEGAVSSGLAVSRLLGGAKL